MPADPAAGTAMPVTSRPTPRRAVAGVAMATVATVVSDPAAVQGRTGRERARPFRTRLPK